MKMPSHPQQSIIRNSVQQPAPPNNNQTLKKVIELLKTDNGGPGGERHGTQSSERLMELLKANPQLMASTIMQRNAIKQASQAQPPQQQKQHYIPQTNMTSISSVQQQSMSGVGVQQVRMQSNINQLGMNMPVQGSNMQPMHWQQQQQQQRRMQLQHQPSQGQFQMPAPPYSQQAQAEYYPSIEETSSYIMTGEVERPI